MSAASSPLPPCDLSCGSDELPEGRLTDSRLGVKSAPDSQGDLTDSHVGVKSSPATAGDLTDSYAAVKPAPALSSGLTHSPLGVKPEGEVSAARPPSTIADLTRPLFPLQAPDPPTVIPFEGVYRPEDTHKRLWARNLEEGVHQLSQEEAAGASVPQVQPLRESDARCRTTIRGRTVVDQARKQAMLTLLGVGFSLRMTAAYVGVSHQTVANVLAGDPAFAEDVRQARERSKVFPLNCILRECGRSWKAATWLLDYIERQQDAERSDADKHIERVRAKALALIERDLAKQMRKKAAQEGYPPWLPEENGASQE